jgi:hypothetical protein
MYLQVALDSPLVPGKHEPMMHSKLPSSPTRITQTYFQFQLSICPYRLVVNHFFALESHGQSHNSHTSSSFYPKTNLIALRQQRPQRWVTPRCTQSLNHSSIATIQQHYKKPTLRSRFNSLVAWSGFRSTSRDSVISLASFWPANNL